MSPIMSNPQAHSLGSPPEYFPNLNPSLYLIPCYSKLPSSLTWSSIVVSQLDFLLLVYSISFHLLIQQPQICLIHKSHVTLLIVNLQRLPITLGLKPKTHETLQDPDPSHCFDFSHQLPSLTRLQLSRSFLFLKHVMLIAGVYYLISLSGMAFPTLLPSSPSSHGCLLLMDVF